MYYLQGEQYASFLKTNCHMELLPQLGCKHRYEVKGTTVQILKAIIGATTKAFKICTVAPPPNAPQNTGMWFRDFFMFCICGDDIYSCSLYLFGKYLPDFCNSADMHVYVSATSLSSIFSEIKYVFLTYRPFLKFMAQWIPFKSLYVR